MPTMPIIAMFVLKANAHYLICEYADHSRSKPEELTEAKIQDLLASFHPSEALAFGLALAHENQWVKVS